VLYRGKDLRTLSRAERRAYLRDVQVIFQDPYEVYNPFYKVDHVLETPIDEFGLARTKVERRALIADALRGVGLREQETLGRYPHQLSGGQRQRVMVARALLLRPRLIVADEPVSMVDASLRATILDSLRQLNQQYGISLVYITHDLTTAYQISERIIVLYRGAVAEAGDVELVVKQPRHPYTQLLIGSIPLPDPDRPWQRDGSAPADVVEPSEAGGGAAVSRRGVATHTGCKFAGRCPHTMAMCLEAPPPLFQTDPQRAATCYLHRGHPALALAALGSVLGGVAGESGAAGAARRPA
jgi:peptide/nickel transport system ATP-binding protein